MEWLRSKGQAKSKIAEYPKTSLLFVFGFAVLSYWTFKRFTTKPPFILEYCKQLASDIEAKVSNNASICFMPTDMQIYYDK